MLKEGGVERICCFLFPNLEGLSVKVHYAVVGQGVGV